MGVDLSAAAPFYGVAADTSSVPNIKAPILAHLAADDARVNDTYPAYEAAMKSAGVRYEVFTYPGTQHGFHNNSTPRYNEAAAKLAWERTVAQFKKHLA
jgi:carboxymethylenebutenolidase